MFELGQNHKFPLELVFEAKYGKIVDYSLFGDGYIVVGFSEGFVAHISTHIKEIRNLYHYYNKATKSNQRKYSIAAWKQCAPMTFYIKWQQQAKGASKSSICQTGGKSKAIKSTCLPMLAKSPECNI
jgi:hypothetical protein